MREEREEGVSHSRNCVAVGPRKLQVNQRALWVRIEKPTFVEPCALHRKGLQICGRGGGLQLGHVKCDVGNDNKDHTCSDTPV